MTDNSNENEHPTPQTADSRGGLKRGRAWWMYAAAVVPAVALVAVFAVGLARSIRRSYQWPCEGLQLEKVKRTGLKDVTLERLTYAPSSGMKKAGPFSLGGLRGKTVMVNFWLTSCIPCVRELPSLLELSARAGKRLTLLLITTDSELKDLERFYKTHPRFWPRQSQALVLWDPGGKLAKKLGTKKYPETYFLDRQLRPIHRAVSLRDWVGRAARRCVAYLLEK